MSRLLVLCANPSHLPRDEAEGWLSRELESVLGRDELEGATLTRLGNASADWSRSFDWLIEFRLRGPVTTTIGRLGACHELIADLRLLGMAPTVAVADDGTALELKPS